MTPCVGSVCSFLEPLHTVTECLVQSLARVCGPGTFSVGREGPARGELHESQNRRGVSSDTSHSHAVRQSRDGRVFIFLLEMLRLRGWLVVGKVWAWGDVTVISFTWSVCLGFLTCVQIPGDHRSWFEGPGEALWEMLTGLSVAPGTQ